MKVLTVACSLIDRSDTSPLLLTRLLYDQDNHLTFIMVWLRLLQYNRLLHMLLASKMRGKENTNSNNLTRIYSKT